MKLPDLRTIPAGQWVPIAYRAREEATWVEVPGAPLSIDTAHRLRRDGLIDVATRPEEASFALCAWRRGR